MTVANDMNASKIFNIKVISFWILKIETKNCMKTNKFYYC